MAEENIGRMNVYLNYENPSSWQIGFYRYNNQTGRRSSSKMMGRLLLVEFSVSLGQGGVRHYPC